MRTWIFESSPHKAHWEYTELYSSRGTTLELQTKGKIMEEKENTKDVKEALKDPLIECF